jgi:hypothetical protein
MAPITKNQNESADDFADHVRREIANRRHGGEAEQLEILVFCFLPMRQEVKPDQHCTNESPHHLRNDVGDELCEVSGLNPKAKRYRWVDMGIRAAASVGNIDARHNGETPTGGDDYPSSPLSFRALEQGGSNHTIPEQNQHCRAHEFANTFLKHESLLNFCLTVLLNHPIKRLADGALP